MWRMASLITVIIGGLMIVTDRNDYAEKRAEYENALTRRDAFKEKTLNNHPLTHDKLATYVNLELSLVLAEKSKDKASKEKDDTAALVFVLFLLGVGTSVALLISEHREDRRYNNLNPKKTLAVLVYHSAACTNDECTVCVPVLPPSPFWSK